jgi:hypothetical protein
LFVAVSTIPSVFPIPPSKYLIYQYIGYYYLF